MKFGPTPVDEAEGAILAHSVRLEGGDLKKGRTLDERDLETLREAGITEVLAAAFEPGDVPEDEAAARLARALAAPHIRIADAFTGRANLFAEAAGVLTLDAAAIDAVNRIDEAITIATLPTTPPWPRARCWRRSRSSPSPPPRRPWTRRSRRCRARPPSSSSTPTARSPPA
jgi:molybdenum cofactor cytidylyltransferase